MAVVFTAVKSVLLDPLPYARQSELVQIRTHFPEFLASVSDWMLWRDGEELMRRTRTLASIGFYRTDVFVLPGDNVNPHYKVGAQAAAPMKVRFSPQQPTLFDKLE